jgi:acetyl-CoA synthetase/medium-chain acyl-CoA synthetase
MSDYERLRREFSVEQTEYFNFAHDVIDQWARDPGKRALLHVSQDGVETALTFKEVSDRSMRVAGLFQALGIQKGDPVVVILGRQIAWWETITACTRLGAIYSPGTTQLSARDIAYRVNALKAVAVVTDQANADKIDSVVEACPSLRARILIDGQRADWIDYESGKDSVEPVAGIRTKADEQAVCFFTSGTTGSPKMCMHRHSYGRGHITTGKYWLDLGPDDLHWNISDTGWAKAAWSSYYGPWLCGAALFVHDAKGFDPEDSLSMFGRYPITTFCGAPTVYRLFVLCDLKSVDFGQLRHCVGAGEPLNPEVIEVWKAATGLVIRDGYGQTESVILCGNLPSITPKFGSMGKPMPGIDLAVIDEEGNELPPNTEGEIAVRVKPTRPLGLFDGYRGEPEKTAECFVGDWYKTKDRAVIDEEGYFWFVGRADDVILSAGYRIGPFEVESALLEHPAVAESAVVASPDDKRGEIVKAFVVLAAGAQPSDALVLELQEHTKRVTAPYKYPRKIEFVDSLPKTVSGKIRRVELRAKEWGLS